jgi:phosphoribosylanthranilate isomerase
MFRIKICGLTRPSDARLAAQLGADMIGLIFYRKSPRVVNQSIAREIIACVPPTVARVGVFVNAEELEVLRVAEKLRLDYVQLHGDESPTCIRRLQQRRFRVIKAFSVTGAKDYEPLYKSPADLCLIDNRIGQVRGGTGETFDWALRPSRRISNLVLAGGVSADNLAKGVELFRPMVVDVSSSLESRPGVKSALRMKRFFAKCDRIRYGK